MTGQERTGLPLQVRGLLFFMSLIHYLLQTNYSLEFDTWHLAKTEANLPSGLPVSMELKPKPKRERGGLPSTLPEQTLNKSAELKIESAEPGMGLPATLKESAEMGTDSPRRQQSWRGRGQNPLWRRHGWRQDCLEKMGGRDGTPLMAGETGGKTCGDRTPLGAGFYGDRTLQGPGVDGARTLLGAGGDKDRTPLGVGGTGDKNLWRRDSPRCRPKPQRVPSLVNRRLLLLRPLHLACEPSTANHLPSLCRANAGRVASAFAIAASRVSAVSIERWLFLSWCRYVVDPNADACSGSQLQILVLNWLSEFKQECSQMEERLKARLTEQTRERHKVTSQESGSASSPILRLIWRADCWQVRRAAWEPAPSRGGDRKCLLPTQ